MNVLVSDLRPGDVLLYDGTGIVAFVIETKTGSDVDHVEVYIGQGQTVASRNGIGVDQYPVRMEGLRYVLRPMGDSWGLNGGLRWFQTVTGEGYDWAGLLAFSNLVKEGERKHLFCSSFATLFLRAMGVGVFNDRYEAGRVSPRDFKLSPALTWVFSP